MPVTVYFSRPAGPIELLAAPVLKSILFGGLLLLFGLGLATTESRLGKFLPGCHSFPPSVEIFVSLDAVACIGLALYALIFR